ncbi:MAG TPA: LysM peptidoglycan-binding domain-containing protein [Peptococcaceae bacterium]|nr:LysM peptidoglycan-binding domain-containing protein [Peptococcaceae bacterium]
MFFGKKQTGFMNQPPAMNMVNQPYEGFVPEQTVPMGYAHDPYCCWLPCHDPCMEAEMLEPQVYVVQRGDTVYKIAQKFGLDWRELAGFNHLGNPDLIYPGERLFIPPRF